MPGGFSITGSELSRASPSLSVFCPKLILHGKSEPRPERGFCISLEESEINSLEPAACRAEWPREGPTCPAFPRTPPCAGEAGRVGSGAVWPPAPGPLDQPGRACPLRQHPRVVVRCSSKVKSSVCSVDGCRALWRACRPPAADGAQHLPFRRPSEAPGVVFSVSPAWPLSLIGWALFCTFWVLISCLQMSPTPIPPPGLLNQPPRLCSWPSAVLFKNPFL